ncbi:uncharacterized protein LOC135410070 isoform X2 [Pseudopipra pipra]|uniref:uncharacterized protein LOC135410070 isoform X2 n=1 Tax=Pseudopipra pipra TaxID=415032 RepID=UPI003139C3B6
MGGSRGQPRPAAPLPSTPKAAAAPAGLDHKHIREKLSLLHMSREKKRIGGGSSGFPRAIFSALKIAVMSMSSPTPTPLLPSLRPTNVWQPLTRELLTFEAKALGSNYLLHYPCKPPLSPHTGTSRGWVWRHLGSVSSGLPSTSGYATRSPSSSPEDTGDWDNSWSGLCIPVGDTSLYELQDAVGSSGTKRASNVKETQNGRRDAT